MTRFGQLIFRISTCGLVFLALGIAARAQMPSNCIAGKNIYYIDNVGGSDANSQSQARSKSSPWAHQPYMASFKGSYSHTAGDCFIFKGGDTWVYSDHPTISTGGSSTVNMDYYGTDPAWFAGSTFSRPVFDIQANSETSVIHLNADFVIWDNWEIIHSSCGVNSSNQFAINTDRSNDPVYVTNNYIHDFSSPPSGCGSGGWFNVAIGDFGNFAGCTGKVDHNVIDGSDGNTGYPATLGVIGPCSPITNNIFHDLCNAINSHSHLIAYNLIYNIGPWTQGVANCDALGGLHENAVQIDDDSDVHDNVIYHMSGGELIQITPRANPAWPVSHIYNNVLYSNVPTAIEIGTGGDPVSTGGVLYVYNNTMECGSAGGMGCLQTYVSISALTWENNHLITKDGLADLCINTSPINCKGPNGASASSLIYLPATEVYQTLAVANAQGYSSSQQYAYSPTSASNSTVTIAAMNNSSGCSSLLKLCTDAEYGVQSMPGPMAVAARTPVTRPDTNGWNAGAYSFGSSSVVSPAPPSALSATVQ
jgi:hypothetical protein